MNMQTCGSAGPNQIQTTTIKQYLNCGCIIQSKMLLKPVYLARYFKEDIYISVQSEHSIFVKMWQSLNIARII